MLRDVGLAEEMAQDALVIALEKWPQSGVPDNPGAWLMATAKNRAIDRLRRIKLQHRKHEELGHELEREWDDATAEIEAHMDDDIGDDLLRLVFTACHPVLSMEARVALTLRLLGGLSTDEIARAYLVSESTVAQRIVRAKRTLSEANVPFEVPRGEELDARLSSVLGVIYLIFNEGYSATAGDDLMRPALCNEALRLGRLVAELAPRESEAHGLVALMEIQASRADARVAADGTPILLPEQDRSRWDQSLIERGMVSLARTQELGPPFGPYGLQAAIAACHAQAPTAAHTNWKAIVAFYDALVALTPSPVVELNRAVAVSMADGAAAGLVLVDALADEPALAHYHLLASVRGDLLAKLGRHEEAAFEFTRAASQTRNAREQEFLLARARDSQTAALATQ